MAPAKVAFRFSCAYTSSQILLRSDSLGQTKIIEIYINTKCDFKIVLSAMWFTVLWFAIDWFLRLPCLQNQQREISLHHCFRGRFKTRFFFTNISLYFPEIMKWKTLTTSLQYYYHMSCVRESEKKERQIFKHELQKRKVGKWY